MTFIYVDFGAVLSSLCMAMGGSAASWGGGRKEVLKENAWEQHRSSRKGLSYGGGGQTASWVALHVSVSGGRSGSALSAAL